MLAILAAASALTTGQTQLSAADRDNIALSTVIVQRVGDRLWGDWRKTPFRIDLLTADGPALVNIPKPFDQPKFPRDLEATLFLDNAPTIVIGQPKYTQASTPIRWSVTLLHEHFHQWQYSWPAYGSAVKGLNLAHGANDAMWMLNYAFPYADPQVDARYAAMTDALAGALDAMHTAGFSDAVKRYLSARERFRKSISADDYKYFAFQCWQEGVARYTEIAITRLAVREHLSDPSFLTSAQAAGLLEDSDHTYAGVLDLLRRHPLRESKRVNFYAVGAGEALLLDRLVPDWRARYLDPRMDLSVLFVR